MPSSLAVNPSTGAPDLALGSGVPYSPSFHEFNPPADRLLTSYLIEHPSDRAALANVLYQLARTSADPRGAQLRALEDLNDGAILTKYQLEPVQNLWLLNYVIKAPKSLMARVRWFELVGGDLVHYKPSAGTNLLYDISQVAVSDVLDWHLRNHVTPKRFAIDRGFSGEVLILKGRDDVVFGDAINQQLRDAYRNSRLLLFNDGHRLQRDPVGYRTIRETFLAGGFDAMPTQKEPLTDALP